MYQRADDGSAVELMDLNVVAKAILSIQKAKLAHATLGAQLGVDPGAAARPPPALQTRCHRVHGYARSAPPSDVPRVIVSD